MSFQPRDLSSNKHDKSEQLAAISQLLPKQACYLFVIYQARQGVIHNADDFVVWHVVDFNGTNLEKQSKLSDFSENPVLKTRIDDNFQQSGIPFKFQMLKVHLTSTDCSKLRTLRLTWLHIIPASIFGSIISMADMASNNPKLKFKRHTAHHA